jgi:hypothetical protein
MTRWFGMFCVDGVGVHTGFGGELERNRHLSVPVIDERIILNISARNGSSWTWMIFL